MAYPGTMYGRSLGTVLVSVILVVLALAAGVGHAQVATFGLVAHDAGTSLLTRVTGIRDGDATVDATARLGRDVALGVTWRYAHTLGPVGNVIVEGGGDLLLDLPAEEAFARVALTGRGVIGPVAALLRIDGGSVDDERLDPIARAEAPRLVTGTAAGRWDIGGRASLTYRPDRTTTLTFEPRLRWLDGDVAGFAGASLRWSGLAPELDLIVALEGGAVTGRVAGALGVGAIVTRRREPDSTFRVWLGHDGERFLPGGELLLAQRAAGSSFTLTALYAPHRIDALPWRLAGELVSARGTWTWRVRAGVAGGPEGPVRGTVGLLLERAIERVLPLETAPR
jgi:hypothetical protein